MPLKAARGGSGATVIQVDRFLDITPRIQRLKHRKTGHRCVSTVFLVWLSRLQRPPALF